MTSLPPLITGHMENARVLRRLRITRGSPERSQTKMVLVQLHVQAPRIVCSALNRSTILWKNSG